MFEISTEATKINGVEPLTVSDAQISELISQYGLHTTVDFLRKAWKWMVIEKIPADEEMLNFLDAIFLSSVSKSKNIKISELFSDDEEIVKTFADLFSKYKYLCGTKEKYITLDNMSHLASSYLRTLNVCPPSSVAPTNEIKDVIISDNNGNELLALALDDSPSLPYGYEASGKKVLQKHDPTKKDDLFFLVVVVSFNRTNVRMRFHNFIEFSRRIFLLRVDDALIDKFAVVTLYHQAVVSFDVEQFLHQFSFVGVLREDNLYRIYLLVTENLDM